MAFAHRCIRVLLQLAPFLLAGVAVADWDAGVAAYRAGDWRAALKEFQAVVRNDPTVALAFYRIGQCHQNLGQDAEALAAFREAVRLEPGNPGYAVPFARALLERGDGTQALAALGKLRRDALKPNQRAVVLAVEGRARLSLGDAAAAVTLAQAGVQADPTSAEAQLVLAQASSQLGHDREAFAAYSRAFAASGDSAVGKNAIAAGRRAARVAAGDEKRELYRQAVAVAVAIAEKENTPESMLVAGETLLGAQAYDKALSWLEASGIDDAYVSFARGQCLQGKGELDRAIVLYRRAAAKGPDPGLRKDIYSALGHTLDTARRWTDAAQAYLEAGDHAKVAEMKQKQATAEQNARAEEESRRLEELQRLQEEYQRLTRPGASPSPTPTPRT